MEEKKDYNPIDHPETTSPSVDSLSVNTPRLDSAAQNAPPPDDHDAIGSNLRDFSNPEEKEPGLAKRLAEALRDGVASTKPDYYRRPGVRIPPLAKKNRQKFDHQGILVFSGGLHVG